MGFWDGYRASLKPLEVEETIDLWVHRPLGYLAARAALLTPITANQITVASIVLGVASGALLLVDFPHHMQASAALLFLSTVLDCADGQVARLRKSASPLGRMLDGVGDGVTSAATLLASSYVVWSMYRAPAWQGALALVIVAITMYTNSFHTSAYDFYKNLYLRFTVPGSAEGDDLEAARARAERAREDGAGPVRRATFAIYLFYLKGQRDFIAWFDPAAPRRLDLLPPYDAARAEIWRRHHLRPMTALRRYFGFGSLVFGLVLCNFAGRPDVYLLARFLGYNALFWLWFWPMQRRASREAARELGIGFEPLAAVAGAA